MTNSDGIPSLQLMSRKIFDVFKSDKGKKGKKIYCKTCK